MIRILQGDCRDILCTLPDESVHCCVTSPPYFGLRDYGSCDCGSGRFDLGQGDGTGGNLNYRAAQQFDGKCPKCKGTGRIIGTDSQIGLEQTPQEYVEQLVAVFREVGRVLCRDGTVWLNLGDSYASGGRGGGANGSKQQTNTGALLGPKRKPDGLKDKDLIGIPWRVAFALQADGWWLRQDIIWSKPNPMPESVTDRCTKAHEYIFLLSKSAQYFFDQEPIREHIKPWNNGEMSAPRMDGNSGKRMKEGARDQNYKKYDEIKGANKRSVWTVATQPYSEAHFATFPAALIQPCILAGCPKGGTVLDPFAGAGTTGLVADRLGRNAILIELNPEYATMTKRRIADDGGMFAEMAAE